MKKIHIVTLMLLMAVSLPAAGTREYRDTIDKNYRITMPLPEKYEASVYRENDRAKTYRISTGGNREFELFISIIRYPSLNPDPSLLKRRVEKSGRELLPRCVEETVQLVPLGSGEGAGYYYRLTDKKPAPGEYTVLIQGQMFRTSSLVTFTYLFNRDNAAELADVTAILGGLTVSYTEPEDPDLKGLLLGQSDLKGASMLNTQVICTTSQIRFFYTSPRAYDQLLPTLRGKDIQSVERGDDRGSVMFFHYSEDIEKFRDFFTGLFYGSDNGPSEDHPEEFIIKGDMMVIFCFSRNSGLKKELMTVMEDKFNSYLKNRNL